MRALFICILLVLTAAKAEASSWNTFVTLGSSAIWFFDAESVSRQGDQVTVWVKYVNDVNKPDPDNSYASALRETYFCASRKYQVLNISTYDRDYKFIKSNPSLSSILDVIPDSMGEVVMKSVCSKDFPNDKSGTLYFPALDNDIYKHAERYYRNLKSSSIDLAPK